MEQRRRVEGALAEHLYEVAMRWSDARSTYLATLRTTMVALGLSGEPLGIVVDEDGVWIAWEQAPLSRSSRVGDDAQSSDCCGRCHAVQEQSADAMDVRHQAKDGTTMGEEDQEPISIA